MSAIDAAMPGSSSSVAPFLQRLPSLSAGQKAAAVNLGIFPDANQPLTLMRRLSEPRPRRLPISEASAPTGSPGSMRCSRRSAFRSRRRSAGGAAAAVQQQPHQPSQSLMRRRRQAGLGAAHGETRRRPENLAPARERAERRRPVQRFDRMKSDNEELFKGIPAYVAQSSDRARLVIGPFRGASDAEILSDDLHTVGIEAIPVEQFRFRQDCASRRANDPSARRRRSTRQARAAAFIPKTDPARAGLATSSSATATGSSTRSPSAA